jgi:hypothetical protein
MVFIALTPTKLMTTQEIVNICTECNPNLIKSVEYPGKISFIYLSKALQSCTNFHEPENFKGIMWIPSVENYNPSVKKYTNYSKKFNYTPR